MDILEVAEVFLDKPAHGPVHAAVDVIKNFLIVHLGGQ
jgi:hypothetical protein